MEMAFLGVGAIDERTIRAFAFLALDFNCEEDLQSKRTLPTYNIMIDSMYLDNITYLTH